MIEIVASAVGVLLTALVAFTAYRYRSLIVSDVVQIKAAVKIDGDNIVPSRIRDFRADTEICCYKLTLENKGWKGVPNATFHVREMSGAFSITKKSRIVSEESISIYEKDGSLEIAVSYFPRGEKIEIGLADFGSRSFHAIKGAGPSYKCESAEYYLGYQGAARFLINMVAIAGIIYFTVSLAANATNDVPRNPAPVKAGFSPHA